MKKILNIASFSLAGLLFAGLAFGWTNPSGTPPAGSGAVNADTSGNVGIGISASASYKLNVDGDSRGTRLCIGTDCRNSWPSAGLGTTGSPTVNKLTKFTGATTIGNSQLTDNGTNVFIGTVSSPTEKFEVSGGKIKSSGTGSGFCIGPSCIASWPTGNVTGGGTSGKIPKWTGPNSLGDSSLTESGGVTNIGATNDLSADGNVWGAQTNTQVGPNFAWPIQRWVNNDPWEIKCPNGQYVVGIAQVVTSGYPGAKILCAKL